MADNVKIIAQDSDFKTELEKAGTKLVVVDFHATWCGPCRTIAPVYAAFSTKYPSAVFLKVDVDQCKDTAEHYSVTAMPTFLFLRAKVKLDTVQGADKNKLEEMIKKHIGEESGDSSDDAIPGMMDLTTMINKAESNCLNESDDHPFINALSSDDTFLESDCDEQLLLMITFLQPVKLHSLRLRAPDNGKGPKTVKIFINQPGNMDFDTAEKREAVQKLEIDSSALTDDSILPLRYVKFQAVQSVTLFVMDNQNGDDDSTILRQVQLFGTPVEATNMKEFKRTAGKEGESH